jgi:methylmalonyl-CoA epimerase
MHVKRVDHVGIAVADAEEADGFLQAVLGVDKRREELVEDQGVNTHIFPLAGTKLELLEPVDPDGPVADYLEDHGPGLHHLAVEVADLEKAIETMRERGVEMIDEEPRPGVEDSRIAFCHPRDTQGFLLELVELPDEADVDVLGA